MAVTDIYGFIIYSKIDTSFHVSNFQSSLHNYSLDNTKDCNNVEEIMNHCPKDNA